ncbi:2TM domain-containing protein [Ottowia sp.]|uniref:2TM domain-containing protein n=1 Tax=Ottowia sp. TaxID=1898956 RepID=UPI003A870E77
MPPTALTETEIERLARRRAGAKMGWYIHAAVYVAVNLMLIALSLYQGRSWFIFPLLSWGLGLALHGGGVWLAGPGCGLRQRLIERERAALAGRAER